MTSPPLIVDASLAVRSAMVPYRAEIEEIAAVQATRLFDASSPHSEDGGSGSGPHQHLQLQ